MKAYETGAHREIVLCEVKLLFQNLYYNVEQKISSFHFFQFAPFQALSEQALSESGEEKKEDGEAEAKTEEVLYHNIDLLLRRFYISAEFKKCLW